MYKTGFHICHLLNQTHHFHHQRQFICSCPNVVYHQIVLETAVLHEELCMAVTEWIQNGAVSICRGPEIEKSGKGEHEVIAAIHGSDGVI